MYFDLNVPIPQPTQSTAQVQTKKGKGKQPSASTSTAGSFFTPAQITALETRLDLLVQLGYTVIALNQTVYKKVEPKAFVNALDPLLGQLRKRQGIIYLKRLTIVLDEDSEKGFGLTNANASLFAAYDIIALHPTTETTFSLACLTHTAPSSLTAHIVSLPLTLPRLPFRMKHKVVRAALRNGAVFEINYTGALGGAEETDGGGGAGAKRNWWAGAREVVRVTKGKGVVVNGGVTGELELRAPRDVGNLITFLGLPQNLAHDASTTTPKSLVLRAQTRKTYRAVFSEPKVIIPESLMPQPTLESAAEPDIQMADSLPKLAEGMEPNSSTTDIQAPESKKRRRDDDQGAPQADKKSGAKKKKKSKEVPTPGGA